MRYPTFEPVQGQPEQTEASEAEERQRSRRALLCATVGLLGLLLMLIGLFSRQLDASSWGRPGVRLVMRFPGPLLYTLFGLLVLAGTLMLAALFSRAFRYRRRKDPDGIQIYRQPQKLSPGMLIVLLAMVLLPIGLLVFFHWAAGKPLFSGARLAPPKAPVVTVTPLPRAAYNQKPAAEAPAIHWILFSMAAVAGVGLLAGGGWILFGEELRRRRSGAPFEGVARRALAEAVEVSLEGLLEEPDARRAVIACYYRLEQVLNLHGLPRAPWQTPREYLRDALPRFHVSAAPLRVLTALFELAKFSGHPVEKQEKGRAVAALREVKAALEGEDHVSPA